MVRMVIGRAVNVGPASMEVRITGGRTLTTSKVLHGARKTDMLAVLMHPGKKEIEDVMFMREWNKLVGDDVEEPQQQEEQPHEELPDHSVRVCSQTDCRTETVGALEDSWTDITSGDGGFALDQSGEEAPWD